MKRGLTFQIVVSYGVLLAVLSGAFVALAVAVLDLKDASKSETHSAEVLETANALEKTVLDLETGLRGYLLTGELRFLTPYRNAQRTYPALATQLEDQTVEDDGQHGRAQAIAAATRAYDRVYAAPLIARAAHDLAGARRIVAAGEGKRRVDALRVRFDVFDEIQERVEEGKSRDANHEGVVGLWLALGSMAFFAAVLVGFVVGLRKTIVAPVRSVSDAFVRVGRGELSVRVPQRGAAEVGALAVGFNAMAENLELQRDELENQTAELEAQQLEIESALRAVEEEKQHTELLARFGDLLAAASGVEEVTRVALRELGDQADAEIGAAYVLDERTGDFALVARRGLAAEDLVESLAPGDGLAGRALAERRPVTASYGDATMRLPGLVSDRDAAHELHLPLRHGARTIGVVSLGRSHDTPFAPSELRVLETLGARAAVVTAEALSVRNVETLARELETVLGSTDEGIYTIDGEGSITLVNRAALELTGYVEDELIGRDAHELLHHTRVDGLPYPREECPIYGTLATGEPTRIEDDCFWRKDGSSFPVEFAAAPLREGDEIVGAVVSFVDITERKRVERQRDVQHAIAGVLAQVTSTQEALPRLLAAVCDGFDWPLGFAWYPADDGELRCFAHYASPQFEEEARRRADGAHSPTDGPATAAFQRREAVVQETLLADRRLSAAIGVPIVGLGGELVGVAEFFSREPLEIEGLLETLSSIAVQTAQFVERKRAEAQAEQMRQEFVATVSHELRTPLTSINGWLHVVLSGEAGPLNDDQRRFLETVQRNSDRLARLVGDLLVARQIETGNLALELDEVDVAGVVRESLDLVGAAADAKAIELSSDLQGPAIVRGDRVRLLQLFDNLLTNAIKFTPEQGHVGVRLAVDGDACRVEVSDTGVGIPPEEREHLFERFFRASSARAHGIGGTGLGLAISQAIAEGHGGTIRLADREGPGSTFVVELPLSSAEAVA